MCENYHGANYELAKAEADKVDEKIIEALRDMQDKKNMDIVDSQGNVIKSIKDNKTKQFLKDNIWNILSNRSSNH